MPEQFNRLGLKLAARTEVPVVPVAVSPMAWGNGRNLKEFAPFRPEIPLPFCFGAPFLVNGKGSLEQPRIIHFIQQSLDCWHIS